MTEEGHHGEESQQEEQAEEQAEGEGGTQGAQSGGNQRPQPIVTGGEKGHATFRREVTRHGHVLAPRVAHSPAEERLHKEHEEQIEELRAARGDVPRPITIPGAGSSV